MSQNATPAAKEYHHGRTPAAWASTITAGVAFLVGSIAAILGPNWPLIWVAVGLLVLSVVLGTALRKLGYGQATTSEHAG